MNSRMSSGARLTGILLFFAIGLGGSLGSVMRERLVETPDFTQTDPRGRFAGRGSQYCAPVAVSNSLMWLADRGYPRLIPQGVAEKEAQIAVIARLASPAYMNTDPNTGTHPAKFLSGLERYVQGSGYVIRRLEYEGPRPVPARYYADSYAPDPTWIRAAMENSNTAVWLSIGWYRNRPGTNDYVRTGGHWVTLVAFGANEMGNPAPGTMVIHNPSPRASRGHDTVTLVRISSGRLIMEGNGGRATPRNARGFHAVKGDLPIQPGTDVAIMDGAVVLALRAR